MNTRNILVYKEHKSTHNTQDQGSGTPNGAQSDRNTKDRKNKYPIILKLIVIIIIITYLRVLLTKCTEQ